MADEKSYLDGVAERAQKTAHDLATDPIGMGVAGPGGMLLTPEGRERLKKLFNIGGGDGPMNRGR